MATVADTAQSSSTPAVSSSLAFLVQVSRPGLWTTTALFYLMPLGRVDFFHSFQLWIGLFYVLIPLGLLLYGTNDIVDAQTDLHNPRKGTYLFGARGMAQQLAKLKWQIALAQIPFLILFYFWIGPRIVWWFALMLLAVVVYNARPFAWKGRPPFDVFIQGSYMLIFLLSSWLNHAPQLPWQTFLFGSLFAMHSHIFGEVMDIEPDRLSGRRTTATVIGRVASKIVLALLLSVETVLVYLYFQDRIVAGFLALGVLWFLIDAGIVWRNRAYSPFEMRLFMWGWNAAAILGIFWNWRSHSFTSIHALRVWS